jgi:hypothetical protein
MFDRQKKITPGKIRRASREKRTRRAMVAIFF